MGITTKLMVHEHVIFDLDTRGAKWELAYIETTTPLTQALK
jgi:hypothetical protein